MKRFSVASAVTLSVFLSAESASATTITLEAILSGSQVVAPVVTSATGLATAIYDDKNTVSLLDDDLAISMSFSGLSGPTTNSDIHLGPVGVNGPIVVEFTGFTFGGTSGTYMQTFPNTDSSNTQVVFGTLAGGLSLTDLLAGNAYILIQDEPFFGGEIRGQLQQIQVVPEPASLLLLGTGLIGAGSRRYRRRQ